MNTPLPKAPLGLLTIRRIVGGWIWLWAVFASSLAASSLIWAAEPLSKQIDKAIAAKHQGPFAGPSTDAEFMRRVCLDLTGIIPTPAELRTFLADKAADKRTKLIDRLLESPDYARRMRDYMSVMLIQRRKPNTIGQDEWEAYLEKSFASGKPYDQLVRELISSSGVEEDTRPAMLFFTARGATNHKAHALDLGRLLLGRDLECAQCHDHPSISDYKQGDFYGLVAFMNRSYLHQDKKTKKAFLTEKGVVEELTFSSVFTGESATATPHLPGGQAINVPTFEKGKELAEEASEGKPPLPKFPLRPKLAESLTSVENVAFRQNAANRLWAMMMGRGLVHPLDMHHSENPPSHPELLKLLGDQLAAMKYDTKSFLRELALSETYQRSSRLPEGTKKLPAESFAVANFKPLSPEQLTYSILRSTGHLERVLAEPATPEATQKYRPDKGKPIPAQNLGSVLKLFRSVYAAQPGETEDEFFPSLASSLFVSNEKLILEWLAPEPGTLLARLTKLPQPEAVADELYLTILSRYPTGEERTSVTEYLKECPDTREAALREMAWALLACSEFRLNH